MSIVTVSCSSDNDDVNEPRGLRFENGKVFYGRCELPNNPVDLDSLPEWLKENRMTDRLFTLLEGTWKGQHAYYYSHICASLIPDFFYLDDGYGTISFFKEEEVDWSTWTCLHDWRWYVDYSLDESEEE